MNKLASWVISLIALLPPAPLSDLSPPSSPKNFFQEIGPSVVYINPVGDNSTGGTGFQVITPNGELFILTNDHVCALASPDGYVSVNRDFWHSPLLRKVIKHGGDKVDLCLVEPVPGMAPLTVSRELLQEGEHIRSLGHPRLLPLTPADGAYLGPMSIDLVEFEIATDEDRARCSGPLQHIEKIPMFIFEVEACMIKRDSIYTNLETYGGSSGSPIVNDNGQVVSVIFAGQSAPPYGFGVNQQAMLEFLSVEPSR